MKLHQMGSVREYQTQFEWLASRVQEWPERALVGSYIGGLKDEIQSEVKLFHPTTLVHATSLARLQEDMMQRQRRGLTWPGLLPAPLKPPNVPTTTPKLPQGMCHAPNP